MSDVKEVLAVLLVAIALRALDWFAPKGHHSKLVERYGEKDDEDEQG